MRRLLRDLQRRGDKAVLHGLRGRPSPPRIGSEIEQQAAAILSRPEYRGFWRQSFLAKKHKIEVSRETLRGWMIRAKLWRARQQAVEAIYEWRARRSRFAELVQWGHQ